MAASLALVASTAIAVAVGDKLLEVVPLVWVKRGSGILFVVLGVLTLLAGSDAGGKHESAPESTQSE